MANDGKMAERIMGDQSIADSFRGILRVAAIQDLSGDIPDVPFHGEYYGTPTGLLSDQNESYDSAKAALSGGTQRYNLEDPYLNNKVPVTDSVGHYLNINLGADSTVIGMDDTNNGNSAATTTFTQMLAPKTVTQSVIYPVLESTVFTLGLEKIKMPESKSKVNHATINFDSGPSSEPLLIFENNYDHTNIESGNYKAKTGNPRHRTIFRIRNKNVQDYDVLMHQQDNWDNTNTANNVFDSYVDVVNLKNYVKEKITKYVGSNVSEVPSGTIVYQYVSLDKWYGVTEDEGQAGHRPVMNRSDYKGLFASTLYQDVVSYKVNRLSTQDGTGAKRELAEVIPLYKRDYLLCDGSSYTIHCVLPDGMSQTHYNSFARFINLFYILGYHYTELGNIRPHFTNVARTVNGTKIYEWANKDNPSGSNECKDKDVLWDIDMAMMMAVICIQEELTNGTSQNGISGCLNPSTMAYDRTRAENWLKTAKIPIEYIWNSMIPEGSGNNAGMYYSYTPKAVGASGKQETYKIPIGREVNSFSSLIRYWDCAANNYVVIELWKIAEVQAVLDAFAMNPGPKNAFMSTYCNYSFQVPSFKFETDKYTMGGFVGSSPFYWSEEAKEVTQTQSITTWDDTLIPHRHYIMMGAVKDFKVPGPSDALGKTNVNAMARAEGPYDYVLTEHDYFCPGFGETHQFKQNYVMCEINGLKYNEQFIGGVNAKVIQFSNNTTYPGHPDPRWQNAEPNRGATSPPVFIVEGSAESAEGTTDAKYESATGNTSSGTAEYFSPECMLFLPLIKI